MPEPQDSPLLAGLDARGLAAHGVPTPSQRDRRGRAHAVVTRLLGSQGVRVSPLGPEWSGDIDVHAEAPAPEVLRSAGWLPLDGLDRRLGARPGQSWAVVDDVVLGKVDFTDAPMPAPVDAVLRRVRRRGEVRWREVLELRALVEAGVQLPRSPEVAAAAELESTGGGDVLAPWREDAGPGRSVSARARALAARRAIGRRRRRPVVVALSGVDGAGKSTLSRHLLADLSALGIDADVVWTRPGMGLGWLAALATLAKRLLKQSSAPGVRAVAAGSQAPAARRGLPGLVWVLLVLSSFVLQAQRPRAAGHQALVYDRHLPDALVTLDVFYPGVPSAVPEKLVRWGLPTPDLACYLDVPAEVLRRRKPDDTMGAQTVDAQLRAYARRLPAVPGVVVLDGTRPPGELSLELVQELLTRLEHGTVRHSA